MQLTMTAALTLVIVTFATVTVPHAEAFDNSFRVRLDNNPSPSGRPTNTDTANNVCVKYQVSGGSWQTIDCRPISGLTEGENFCADAVLESSVTAVKITIDGTDAFWLDQWETYYHACANCNCSGTLEATFGVDNQVGFCFSTDSSKFSSYNPGVCTISGTAGHTGSGPSYSEIWWNYP